MRDDELLTAYVDGVAELTPEERRRVEAATDAGELAATRDLLDRLRALPTSVGTTEPDWPAMERAISAQLPDRVPRAWWRVNLRWLVPVVACATASAIAIVVLARHGQSIDGQADPNTKPEPTIATAPTPTPSQAAPAVAAKDPHAGHAFVFLDGQAIDVDDVPETQLLDSLKPRHDPAASPEDDDNNEGLLGSPGLAWVDDLDNAKLDRLENVLAQPTAAPAPAPNKKGT
jgi:hypothetical protein